MALLVDMLDGWGTALSKRGWLRLAVLGWLPGIVALWLVLQAVPGAPSALDVQPVVKVLSPAQLVPALDICQVEGAEKILIANPIEGTRYQVSVRTRLAGYTLTWSGGDFVAIDASAVGQPDSHHSEPASQRLMDCMRTGARPVEVAAR